MYQRKSGKFRSDRLVLDGIIFFLNEIVTLRETDPHFPGKSINQDDPILT